MNENYPQSSIDYDRNFLSHLLRAVFIYKDLKACGEKESIAHFPRAALALTKGNWNLYCIVFYGYSIADIFSRVQGAYTR